MPVVGSLAARGPRELVEVVSLDTLPALWDAHPATAADLEDDYRVHVARGLALAGLGRREEALAAARWLEESVVYRDDAWGGLALRLFRAWLLAKAGEADTALEDLEGLAAGPSWVTVHTLRLDPLFDPLRDHPRYHALVATYAEE